MKHDYLVVLEKTATGFSAYVPDLPGCITVGDTKEEVMKHMQEAIHLHLEGMREDGWYQVAQRGSHRQFKHPNKTGRVTVPVPDHGSNKDLAKGTENSILKQAGLK